MPDNMEVMVTPAGKDLLRNTIQTAKFHNRILEENDMWRQWELEKGLTMMVSDDAIRKKSRHRCRYHEKIRKTKLEKLRHRNKNDKSSGSSSSSQSTFKSENTEKWDHGGFAELYPDEATDSKITTDEAEHKATKRLKKDQRSEETDSEHSDEDVWAEFRKFKRTTRLKSSASKNLSPSDFEGTFSDDEKRAKKYKRSHKKHRRKKE